MLGRRSPGFTGLERLWEHSRGDPAVCIAVIDTLVDTSHPCFADAQIKFAPGYSIPGQVNSDAFKHGTAVASLIFGSESSLVRGVAPGCRGLLLPAISSFNGGVVSCSQVELAHAINTAVEHGANIINISAGQLSPSGVAIPILQSAIQRCADLDILIVAAAGNDGCDCLHVPAASDFTLPVAAEDTRGKPLKINNWGESYRRRGILAPGENLVAADLEGKVSLVTGTSFATAIVSGVVGLLLSVQRRCQMPQSPTQIAQILRASANRCAPDSPNINQCLLGRMDIIQALSQILNSGESMTEKEVVIDQPSIDEVATISTVTPGIEPLSAKEQSQIVPAGCGCEKKESNQRQHVYVLGEIGIDFGIQARRDAFVQKMSRSLDGANANMVDSVLSHLKSEPWDAESLLWTLSLDETAIYAIRPVGAFADKIYETLQSFLSEQSKGNLDRVSIPGIVSGKVRLLDGQTVPVIIPEARGIYGWTTTALLDSVLPKDDDGNTEAKRQSVLNFLDRVYYELRNLGATSQDRAINYAATNAFSVEQIFGEAIKEHTELSSIEVERSPVCRPDSDCWDVKLTFFNPRNRTEQARTIYRFTVDVSDVVPVTIGRVRRWHIF